ncbi:MAG: hypothetical protein AAB403_16535 [Planctomycetota bacterium]
MSNALSVGRALLSGLLLTLSAGLCGAEDHWVKVDSAKFHAKNGTLYRVDLIAKAGAINPTFKLWCYNLDVPPEKQQPMNFLHQLSFTKISEYYFDRYRSGYENYLVTFGESYVIGEKGRGGWINSWADHPFFLRVSFHPARGKPGMVFAYAMNPLAYVAKQKSYTTEKQKSQLNEA